MDESQALSILGFKTPVSVNDLKKAYRNLVLKKHPDKNSKYSVQRFVDILDAYVFLKGLYTQSDPNLENYTKFSLLIKDIFSNWSNSKYTDALKDLDIIIAEIPEFLELEYVKAITLIYLENYDDALKSFEKCLGFEHDIQFWNNMAFCYSKLNNHSKILMCCDKILELNPKNPEYWWFNKAVGYYELHHLEQSIKCIDNVLKIDPNANDALELRKKAVIELSKKNSLSDNSN